MAAITAPLLPAVGGAGDVPTGDFPSSPLIHLIGGEVYKRPLELIHDDLRETAKCVSDIANAVMADMINIRIVQGSKEGGVWVGDRVADVVQGLILGRRIREEMAKGNPIVIGALLLSPEALGSLRVYYIASTRSYDAASILKEKVTDYARINPDMSVAGASQIGSEMCISVTSDNKALIAPDFLDIVHYITKSRETFYVDLDSRKVISTAYKG